MLALGRLIKTTGILAFLARVLHLQVKWKATGTKNPLGLFPLSGVEHGSALAKRWSSLCRCLLPTWLYWEMSGTSEKHLGMTEGVSKGNCSAGLWLARKTPVEYRPYLPIGSSDELKLRESSTCNMQVPFLSVWVHACCSCISTAELPGCPTAWCIALPACRWPPLADPTASCKPAQSTIILGIYILLVLFI